MNQSRQVVSISLPQKSLMLLKNLSKKEEKSRSQLIREFINRYAQEEKWQQIFDWGEKTAKEFKIRSEADVLRLVND